MPWAPANGWYPGVSQTRHLHQHTRQIDETLNTDTDALNWGGGTYLMELKINEGPMLSSLHGPLGHSIMGPKSLVSLRERERERERERVSSSHSPKAESASFVHRHASGPTPTWTRSCEGCQGGRTGWDSLHRSWWQCFIMNGIEDQGQSVMTGEMLACWPLPGSVTWLTPPR